MREATYIIQQVGLVLGIALLIAFAVIAWKVRQHGHSKPLRKRKRRHRH
jgi:uncharacterized membrane protein YqjE